MSRDKEGKRIFRAVPGTKCGGCVHAGYTGVVGDGGIMVNRFCSVGGTAYASEPCYSALGEYDRGTPSGSPSKYYQRR